MDMDGFAYKNNWPHLMPVIGPLLIETEQADAQLVLFTENKNKLIRDLYQKYGPQAECLFKYIHEANKQKRIDVINNFLSPYKTSAHLNQDRSSSGSRILGSKRDTNIYLVVYYAGCDKEAFESTIVSDNCRLILINQIDSAHLDSLRDHIGQFNVMKQERDTAQEKEFELLTNELVNGQKYLLMLREYHYQRAENNVVGYISLFVREQKASFAARKNFTDVLPQHLKIGNLLNVWNIYDCIVDELVKLKPDLFTTTNIVRAELFNCLKSLKENQNDLIKQQLGSLFYGRLMQFYSSLGPNKECDFSSDQSKVKYWEQLVCELTRARNIKIIKQSMLKFIEDLNKQGDKKNWIKKKIDEDRYNQFVKYLAYTEEDIAQQNIEEGAGVWIHWNQIEVDCVVIRELYSKLINKNIIFYVIQYVEVSKMDITIEEKSEEIPLFSDKTLTAPYKEISVAFDRNEETIEYFLIDKNGVKPIKAKDLKFDARSEGEIITFGVHQKVTKNNEFNKNTRQMVNFTASQFAYASFVINGANLPRPVPDYHSDVSNALVELKNKIQEYIKESIEMHKAFLQANPIFPVPVSTSPGERIINETINDTNIGAELIRFSSYLNNQINDLIRDFFNGKINSYHDPVEWLQTGLILTENTANSLAMKCDRTSNFIHNAQDMWTRNSKIIALRKKNPSFSLKSSNINFAAISNQPVFEINNVYYAARCGSIDEFKKYLDQEKRCLGTRFHIDRSREGCRDTQAFDELSTQLEKGGQENQLLRGRNILQNAVNRGNTPVVEHLLDVEKANPNYQLNIMDLPPIYDWVRHLSRKLVGEGPHILDLLLRFNANPNIVSQNLQAVPGGTFLHYIADLGHFWTMEIVLNYIVLSKGGNTRIELFKKTEAPLSKEAFTPKTAMLCAAIHENFKIYNVAGPSRHYKTLEGYLRYGIVFAADEIAYLNSCYSSDEVAMSQLQKLCAIPLQEYDYIISAINSESPTKSPTKLHPKVSSLLHRDLFPQNQIFDDVDLDEINVDLAKILVNKLLINLGLKLAESIKSPAETAFPLQSARISSMKAEKPQLTRSNSEEFKPLPTTLPATKNEGSSSPLKKLFNLISRDKAPIPAQNNLPQSEHNGTIKTSPKKAGSAIHLPQGRQRADSLNVTELQRSRSDIRIPQQSLLMTDTQQHTIIARGRADTSAPRLNLEEEQIKPETITFDQYITLDSQTGLAMIHNVCISGEIVLFYCLINKEEAEQDKKEQEKGKEPLIQNGIFEENKKKTIKQYQLLSTCSAKLRVPFYYAVLFNHFEFIDKLIELKAPLMPDPDKLIDCCKTPLHAAIENLKKAIDNKDIKLTENIKKLIEKILNYADETKTLSCIMMKDKNGHTPLIKAAIYELEDVMKMIIARRIWIPQFDQLNILSEKSLPDKYKRKKIFECIKRVYSVHFQKLLPSFIQVEAPRKTS